MPSGKICFYLITNFVEHFKSISSVKNRRMASIDNITFIFPKYKFDRTKKEQNRNNQGGQ